MPSTLYTQQLMSEYLHYKGHGLRCYLLQEKYVHILLQSLRKILVLIYCVLPWLNTNYMEGNYVWTLDSASCQAVICVQRFCKAKFIGIWTTVNLNLLESNIKDILDHSIKTSHLNINNLKIIIRWRPTTLCLRVNLY